MSDHEHGLSGNGGTQAALPQDGDDAPMVHVTPVDYASRAHEEREKLRGQGKEAVVSSELPTLIPRRDGESDNDYAQRLNEGMKDLIRRGLLILNDQLTHDRVPDMYHIDGHSFNVGPNSGITKGEYRDFSEWMGPSGSYASIPERFLKFEVPPTSPKE